jgi:hypothetical protein
MRLSNIPPANCSKSAITPFVRFVCARVALHALRNLELVLASSSFAPNPRSPSTPEATNDPRIESLPDRVAWLPYAANPIEDTA